MNTWFQFKQFTIHQQHTAMKVCTDACLLGAWFSKKIIQQPIANGTVLDVGCGTGLLSLMLAQQHQLPIDAVEIDAVAYIQANENIALTQWQQQITVYSGSIQTFEATKQYDYIISNPPFFEQQLPSNNTERNVAMHTTSLTFEALIIAINTHLKTDGIAGILLPFYAVAKFQNILNAQGLYIVNQTNVAHSPKHPFFRTMLLIAKKMQPLQNEVIYIKDDDGKNYHAGFINLLKDYYLAF